MPDFEKKLDEYTQKEWDEHQEHLKIGGKALHVRSFLRLGANWGRDWERKRSKKLVEALKHYDNETDNDTYLDVFDCIKITSPGCTEFDEVKFGKVAREAIAEYAKGEGAE